jgi:geranylgeranyl pyrophosphate synthase
MELYPHIDRSLSEIEAMMERDLSSEDPRVYGMLAPFLRRGGKRIRPALCLLACGACGGRSQDALLPAAIIEMFHNFTLIHDDIEDQSQFRRGEPSLHIQHGLAIALNSGDALYTLLWDRLVSLPLPPARLVRMQKIYVEAFKRVVDGQGIELDWIRKGRFDVSEEEYLQMIGGKTSALIGLSCEAGALIAGAGKSRRASLRSYGESIGAAFQIQDDVLNLTGDFEKYKKEIGGDVSEGKRTLMVVHCLSGAKPERARRLSAILSSHTRDQGEIREAIAILEESGSIEYARRRAGELVNRAKAGLRRMPESADKSSLMALADYVVSRDL